MVGIARQHDYEWFVDPEIHECAVLVGRFQPDNDELETDYQHWLKYLRTLPARQLASHAVAAAAEHLWDVIVDAVPQASPPNANPLDDGGIRFSWLSPGQYMQVEISPQCAVEWFFRNSLAKVSDFGESVSEIDEIATDKFVERLSSMF